jgi:transglutaminase-like putative cysteine protease
MLYALRSNSKVHKLVTLEAGEPVDVADFLKDGVSDGSFVTDVSTIDTTQPGEYPVTVRVGKKEYDTTLQVEDTVAPTANAVEGVITNLGELPQPDTLVTDVTDATNVEISYKKEPKVNKEGQTSAVVLLTDAGNNKSTVDVTITVISDTEPPVIEGAKDLEIYVGDTVAYKQGVSVTDDQDENPTLEIDNSAVSLDSAGSYPVIYTATDQAGNQSTVQVTLTVKEKPEGYIEPDVVYALADEVLAEITDDSMSDMQKAFAIYNWTRTHISYTGTSDKSSWTLGAYQGFTQKKGDCYNYFAVAKALLDCAGIENTDIVKSDTSHSSHYWSLINLGDGWYHFDATPRKGEGDNFFMVTDEELNAYSVAHDNSHIFDSSLYPERATQSVQDKVNYSTGTISE